MKGDDQLGAPYREVVSSPTFEICNQSVLSSKRNETAPTIKRNSCPVKEDSSLNEGRSYGIQEVKFANDCPESMLLNEEKKIPSSKVNKKSHKGHFRKLSWDIVRGKSHLRDPVETLRLPDNPCGEDAQRKGNSSDSTQEASQNLFSVTRSQSSDCITKVYSKSIPDNAEELSSQLGSSFFHRLVTKTAEIRSRKGSKVSSISVGGASPRDISPFSPSSGHHQTTTSPKFPGFFQKGGSHGLHHIKREDFDWMQEFSDDEPIGSLECESDPVLETQARSGVRKHFESIPAQYRKLMVFLLLVFIFATPLFVAISLDSTIMTSRSAEISKNELVGWTVFLEISLVGYHALVYMGKALLLSAKTGASLDGLAVVFQVKQLSKWINLVLFFLSLFISETFVLHSNMCKYHAGMSIEAKIFSRPQAIATVASSAADPGTSLETKNTNYCPWDGWWINSALGASLLCSLLFFIEKLILQRVAVGFHRNRYEDRIRKAKFSENMLSILIQSRKKIKKTTSDSTRGYKESEAFLPKQHIRTEAKLNGEPNQISISEASVSFPFGSFDNRRFFRSYGIKRFFEKQNPNEYESPNAGQFQSNSLQALEEKSGFHVLTSNEHINESIEEKCELVAVSNQVLPIQEAGSTQACTKVPCPTMDRKPVKSRMLKIGVNNKRDACKLARKLYYFLSRDDSESITIGGLSIRNV
jgi:hypothetical protein